MSSLFLDPKCDLDIFEHNNKQDYMDCAKQKYFMFAFIASVVIVLVIIIIAMFSGIGAMGLTISAVILGAVWGGYYLSGMYASRSYETMQLEVQNYMDQGFTKQQALNKVRQEDMFNKQIKTMQSNNNTGSVTSGLLGFGLGSMT